MRFTDDSDSTIPTLEEQYKIELGYIDEFYELLDPIGRDLDHMKQRPVDEPAFDFCGAVLAQLESIFEMLDKESDRINLILTK